MGINLSDCSSKLKDHKNWYRVYALMECIIRLNILKFIYIQ